MAYSLDPIEEDSIVMFGYVCSNAEAPGTLLVDDVVPPPPHPTTTRVTATPIAAQRMTALIAETLLVNTLADTVARLQGRAARPVTTGRT